MKPETYTDPTLHIDTSALTDVETVAEQDERRALAERVRLSNPEPDVETVARQQHTEVLQLIEDLVAQRNELNEMVKARRAEINEKIREARHQDQVLSRVVSVFDNAHATGNQIALDTEAGASDQ